MKTGARILAGVAGVTALAYYSYRAGFNNLTFGLGKIIVSGNRIGLQIICFNPSRWFVYPVPAMFLNVFDSNSNYIGSVKAENMQYIQANGYTILQAYVMPDYVSLIGLLSTLVGSQNLDSLIVHGALQIGDNQIEVNTEFSPATT